LIPQKNRFSEAGSWDEPEEELYRVFSKEEMAALQASNAVKHPPLSPWKILFAQVVVTALSMVIWSVFGEPVGVSLYTQSAFLGGLISVLPSALFLSRLELAKKNANIESRELFGGIGFGRIYQNCRYFDAVYRGCISDPGRALGPVIGDLCACP
jgi:hypothetical protein